MFSFVNTNFDCHAEYNSIYIFSDGLMDDSKNVSVLVCSPTLRVRWGKSAEQVLGSLHRLNIMILLAS